jgi:uncharacterized membrane protein
MGKGRLEAFSYGVMAVIITIMVLELADGAGSLARSTRVLAGTAYSFRFATNDESSPWWK